MTKNSLQNNPVIIEGKYSVVEEGIQRQFAISKKALMAVFRNGLGGAAAAGATLLTAPYWSPYISGGYLGIGEFIFGVFTLSDLLNKNYNLPVSNFMIGVAIAGIGFCSDHYRENQPIPVTITSKLDEECWTLGRHVKLSTKYGFADAVMQKIQMDNGPVQTADDNNQGAQKYSATFLVEYPLKSKLRGGVFHVQKEYVSPPRPGIYDAGDKSNCLDHG